MIIKQMEFFKIKKHKLACLRSYLEKIFERFQEKFKTFGLQSASNAVPTGYLIEEKTHFPNMQGSRLNTASLLFKSMHHGYFLGKEKTATEVNIFFS